MLRIRLILQDLQVHTDQYLQVCIIVIKSIYLLFKWYFKYILLQVIICINHFMYFQSMAETSGEVLMHITSHCRVGKECQWQNMRKSWSRNSNPGVDFDMMTITILILFKYYLKLTKSDIILRKITNRRLIIWQHMHQF